MSTAAQEMIAARIRDAGPITVAEFMEIALYHRECGYYAARPQRSGRAGDFYTSVDVGPLFGACVAQHLAALYDRQWASSARDTFDLVEAAAGNGRLSRDILDAAQRDFPEFYATIRLHLVERSASARAAQTETLGPHGAKLASSKEAPPASIHGAVVANELLDAMPCHMLAATSEGLREVFVALDRAGDRFVLVSGPLSAPELGRRLDRTGVQLEEGWKAEVSLAATDWVRNTARAIERGQLLLFDYGHDARELYSAAHASGTLVRYCGHRVDGRWTENAGECDLSAHVDFTNVRLTAEAEGLHVSAFVDQTRFLLDAGLLARLPVGSGIADVRQRLAARTLLAPEGLGGTIRVMILERRGEGS